MSDTNGGIGCVDTLAAVAAATENIDTQVVGVNFNISFFGFRKDGDRDGAGMDAALALRSGNTLDAVDARLEFQFRIRCVAFYFENNFFVAAGIVGPLT